VLALLAAAADVPSADEQTNISGYAAGYYYAVPSSPDEVVAIGSVDIRRAHLEGRYGYEDLRTGSAFVGYRFDLPLGPVALAFTPIVGGAFGRTYGFVPGLELAARVWKLEFSSENEYLFDRSRPDANFFYSWSELLVRPVEPIFAGVVLQRTRIFGENRLLDPGAVVGCTLAPFTAKVYAFEPYSAERFYAFALEAAL